MKPWCNYAIHRTTSRRRAAGSKRNKPLHGDSKRRHVNGAIDWWQQATSD